MIKEDERVNKVKIGKKKKEMKKETMLMMWLKRSFVNLLQNFHYYIWYRHV